MVGVRPWARVTLIGPDGVLARADLAGAAEPGLDAVDDLARLALFARRLGARIVLTDVSPTFAALLDLVGLRVEMQGQAELGEQALGSQKSEEEVHTDDPPS